MSRIKITDLEDGLHADPSAMDSEMRFCCCGYPIPEGDKRNDNCCCTDDAGCACAESA
jgi:hypothetical protein